MTAFNPQAMAVILGLVALFFLIGVGLIWEMSDSPGRRWFLLLGIAVIPGLALVFGTNTAMEKAKEPGFCGSCHVMVPFHDDLKNPDSTTLAAVHYQNRYILEHQCYTCHTDYTLFGPANAKMAGLRHYWNYATGSYELPIEIRGPYKIRNCLRCHGESKRYLEAHDAFLGEIEEGTMSCLDCHSPAHPERETRQ